MKSLQFIVRVQSGHYARPLGDKDWERIARKLAKAGKGRSAHRSAVVYVEQPYHCVQLDETGKFSVQKD